MNGAQAKWPKPVNSKPIVYVVMRKSQSGPWRQIIQTIDLNTRVPVTNTNSTLRVLAVDSDGLVTIYSPDETNTTNTSLNNRKRTEAKPLEKRWILQENSLIHQKILVIGELSWEPKAEHGLYLVTWEVDGGGLKGNLYTDETCVTLSLWPNTLYHIQVELVSHRPTIPAIIDSNNIKSEMLDLDTSRAQIVSTESQQLLTVLPSDDTYTLMDQAYVQMKIQQGMDDINNFLSVSDGTSRNQVEFVAGCVTAVILFVIVLIACFVIHTKLMSSKGALNQDLHDVIGSERGVLHSTPKSSNYSKFCKKGKLFSSVLY